ncbi:MAG: sulfite exporter TauE/SafE family protein [bacterium]|nr:sulfite exporter TauE/SafE family protein [bacterium]
MEFILFVCINTFSSFFQSIMGFGSALIAIPLLFIFLDKETILTAVTIIGFFFNLFLMFKIKAPINKKIFYPLFVFSLLGLPLGILILKFVPISILKIATGSMSILFTIILLFSKIKLNNSWFITGIAGFVAGILQTSTSMNGPPVVLVLNGTNTSKNESRKLLVTYFFFINVITLPLFIISGTINTKGIIFGLSSIPFIIVAGFFGNKVSHWIPEKYYRIITLITISITGLIAVNAGLKK